MPSHKRVAVADDSDAALLKGLAMDIGKQVVAYIEYAYPQAMSATTSGFPLSLRNKIYNEIVSAMSITDPAEIKNRLDRHVAERRDFRRWKKMMDETDWEHARQKIAEGMDWQDALRPRDDLS